MTCINCNDTKQHLLALPATPWMHVTVPCEECAAERRGDVEHLDTRPDDRRRGAWDRYRDLRLLSVYNWRQLSLAIIGGAGPDRLSVLRITSGLTAKATSRAFQWVLRWDELVLERQRLGVSS